VLLEDARVNVNQPDKASHNEGHFPLWHACVNLTGAMSNMGACDSSSSSSSSSKQGRSQGSSRGRSQIDKDRAAERESDQFTELLAEATEKPIKPPRRRRRSSLIIASLGLPERTLRALNKDNDPPSSPSSSLSSSSSSSSSSTLSLAVTVGGQGSEGSGGRVSGGMPHAPMTNRSRKNGSSPRSPLVAGRKLE
jgi:hypothetical protein